MRCLTLALLISASAAVYAASGVASLTQPVRQYAHRLVVHRWHSETEWRALDAIATPESAWNPCASYPRRHDCSYTGSNSCGIPQANPCPSSWRGRLWETRYAQVRWLVSYVARRYGSPSGALAFRLAHGWY